MSSWEEDHVQETVEVMKIVGTATAILLQFACSSGPEAGSDVAAPVEVMAEDVADVCEVDSIPEVPLTDLTDAWDTPDVQDAPDVLDTFDTADTPDVPCLPSCAGKLCGDDGCGGSCGVCDDSDPCTDDLCTAVGQCKHSNNTVACDDGNECTQQDTCFAGVCSGNLLPPDELAGLECLCMHDEHCDPVDNHNICDGTLYCDQTGEEDEGICLVDETTVPDCDDGLPCTVDDCDPSAGCQHLPDHAQCADGDVCTDDTCDLEEGCTYSWNVAPCDDEDICTALDTCDGGLCAGIGKSEVPIEDGGCEDGNPCTTHLCDEDDGNCLDDFSDGACEDGDPCTVLDMCDGAGLCVGQDKTFVPLENGGCEDGNFCTEHACNEKSGKCADIFMNWLCDDGDPCTQYDYCSEGECVSGTIIEGCQE